MNGGEFLGNVQDNEITLQFAGGSACIVLSSIFITGNNTQHPQFKGQEFAPGFSTDLAGSKAEAS